MGRRKLRSQTAQQIAQNWASKFGAAGETIRAGVQNTTKDPTALAVQHKQDWVREINAAITAGSWEKGLARSGKAGWQKGMIDKGLPRLASGGTAGMPHYQAFLAQWGPAILQKVDSLPARGDYATNKQRSAALMDWAHEQKGKYRKLWRGA